MAEAIRVADPAQLRARRLRIVRGLRRGLPALACAIVAACVIQTAWRALSTPAGVRGAAASATVVSAPRFFGVTRAGRAFSITGRQGERASGAEAMRISDPVIEIDEAKGQKRLTARSGVYDPQAHRLVLQGGVQMVDGAGARLASESATIDTRTGAVQSQAGLAANNAVGQVTSKAYDIQDNGDRVVFKGGVRGRLNVR
jgi:lipopolysaccharide export system protein LptC